MSRPNFLLISADQQRDDCLGVEGRRIKTPHLDRLAAEGTRFTAAITPNCACQPARTTILTGLLPLTHGVHENGSTPGGSKSTPRAPSRSSNSGTSGGSRRSRYLRVPA